MLAYPFQDSLLLDAEAQCRPFAVGYEKGLVEQKDFCSLFADGLGGADERVGLGKSRTCCALGRPSAPRCPLLVMQDTERA